MGPVAAFLPDGRRLHLQHGPTDLILQVFAQEDVRADAYAAAMERFETLLDGLVREMGRLRGRADPADVFEDPVAQRMQAAVLPHLPVFVTPMAAVAGAVADEVLAAMTDGLPISKAYANNGGDAALHLTGSASLDAALWNDGDAGRITISAADGIGGMATSGWRGRSHSLGIADAVTVLAATAAAADVAATLIANAVDLPGHPAIDRSPAVALNPESDLGKRPVTVGVGPLSMDETAQALDRGASVAESMRHAGLIAAASLHLGEDARTIGLPRQLGE
ncbi:MAG: UPF0280 family protein [Pseudomonadota bacterium]